MIPQKSSYVSPQNIKTVTKEVLYYFVRQPYIEQLWITVAYNILMKFVEEDTLYTRMRGVEHFSNTLDGIQIYKEIISFGDVANSVLEAIDEFTLYRGTELIHEAMFYTFRIKTALTYDIKDFIVQKILQNITTGNQNKTILFAIVTPEMEWYTGVIELEGNIGIWKAGFSTGGNIHYTTFHQREDILDWLVL